MLSEALYVTFKYMDEQLLVSIVVSNPTCQYMDEKLHGTDAELGH